MDFDTLADALKALADPTRLKIVALLTVRECCICELVPVFGISQPAVSKHMSRLKASGLVHERRQGMWVFYALNRERLEAIGISLAHLPDMSDTLSRLAAEGLLVQCTIPLME